jgi:hypothetical protein
MQAGPRIKVDNLTPSCGLFLPAEERNIYSIIQ